MLPGTLAKIMYIYDEQYIYTEKKLYGVEKMYSSLDKIDIPTQSKNGAIIFHQTDHRSKKEIEEDRDMSIIFALVRVLNPKRMAKMDKKKVEIHYDCPGKVPEFLHQAVASAGGKLFEDHKEIVYKGTIVNVEELMNKTLTRIGQETAKKENLDFSIESMKMYERKLAKMKLNVENDEIMYWENVIRTGAFAGEILKNYTGGRWVKDKQGYCQIPIIFEVKTKDGVGSPNFMSKTTKFIENGSEDSIAYMLQTLFKMCNKKETSTIKTKDETPEIEEKKGFFSRLFNRN
jgi:hypothetical protein